MSENDAKVVIVLFVMIGLVLIAGIAGITIESMTDTDMQTSKTIIKTAVGGSN